MPAFRTREVAAVVAGVVLLVALSAATAVLAPASAENLPPGSSFSHGPDGSAAAFLTLERLGYAVARSFDPVSALAIEPSTAVLVMVDPSESPSNADRRAVESLSAAGATVLVTGCGGLSFLTGIDYGPEAAVRSAITTYPARAPSPLSAHAPRVSMSPDCAWPQRDDRYAALYGDARAAVVVYRRTGRGLVIWWAGGTPVFNASIADPGNLELLMNVAGSRGRTILWDEFYHGQRRSLSSYAAHTPLPWVAAQLLLATIVAAAMYARRRAPILNRPVTSRASPLEFVDTMAGLYARAGTAADAVAVARARLRRLLAGATGQRPDAADDRLVAAAAARRHVDSGELGGALAASAVDHGDDLTERDALALVRRLQSCAAALERTGG